MSAAQPLDGRQDDRQWLEWRRQGVTASDIARAASGRYGGAYAVVAEKQGHIEPQPFNARMARGQHLEERVTTAAEALLGLHVVGEQLQVQHLEQPHWRATLDGLAAPVPAPTIHDCTHVVEVKTKGLNVPSAWDYWNPQTQWQMLVSGIPSCLLVEATVDDDAIDGPKVVALRLHEVDADPLAQVILVDIADELWRHLSDGTLPDPNAEALDAVKAVNAIADPDLDVVDLSNLADDIARFAAIKAAAKAAEAERKEIEARIRSAVGAATKGTVDGYEVTVAKPKREVTEEAAAALLAARPDLGKTVLDRDKAATEAKELLEAARQPVGARVVTVKEK